MTKFKMMHRQTVPVGFTIRVAENETLTMRTDELVPHRESIVAFLRDERAYHAKHRRQAPDVLKLPYHEDAAQASDMLRIADGFVQEIDDLMEVFTSDKTLSEFSISQMIMHKMFDALNTQNTIDA
jgi:hypothetical protein